MSIRAILVIVVSLALALPPPSFAQQTVAPAQAPVAAEPAGPPLNIFVLQGQNATNSVPDRTAIEPVVEVRDENQQPVEGADVVFELPATGASGLFPGQQLKFPTKTNLQGQAGAPFTPNMITGRFTIKVTATIRNRTGHVNITQTNAMRPATETVEKPHGLKSRTLKIVLIAAVAGAVTGIIIGVTRGGSSSKPSTTITVTPGSPTFGSP